MRDDRKLIGVLRSYDQYGTLPSLSMLVERARNSTADALSFPPASTAPPAWPPTIYVHLQPANLVLTQTIERLYHPATKAYAQTERGVFLVRGENVVLLGEVVRPLRFSPPLPGCSLARVSRRCSRL